MKTGNGRYEAALKSVLADIRRGMPKEWIRDTMVTEYNYSYKNAYAILQAALAHTPYEEREKYERSEMVREEVVKIKRKEARERSHQVAMERLEEERLISKEQRKVRANAAEQENTE